MTTVLDRAAGAPDATEVDGRRPSRPPAWMVAAVAGAIVAGVVLRFLVRSDLWLDEALTVNTPRLPVRSIPAALRHDGAPPLYYVLLHFWIRMFGAGDFAVRALSGVFAVATLPVLYVAGKRIGGHRVGL